MATATMDGASTEPASGGRFTLLSSNPGKRVAEIWYLAAFAISMPFQGWVQSMATYAGPNDHLLIPMSIVMAIFSWGGATVIRAKEDRGKPFWEVYGFKLGVFLFCWAVIGGYLGTDPWYEVLHGHFAFGTEVNPNGVPFYMLPMTISVFGAYCTVLGVLFRIVWYGWKKLSIAIPDFFPKLVIFLPLAAILPVLETLGYRGEKYCFDNDVGEWFLNVFIYGSWHFSALWFFTAFDERPGVNMVWKKYWVSGMAVVGLTLLLMQLITDYMAPNYTEVQRGVRNLNDWSVDNCLGAMPKD
jgi:hypothetical protein